MLVVASDALDQSLLRMAASEEEEPVELRISIPDED